MSPSDPWQIIGISPTDDIRAIRSAYAVRLKAIDVDTDPAAFRALREAHDRAIFYAHERLWEQQQSESTAHGNGDSDDFGLIDDELDAMDRRASEQSKAQPRSAASEDGRDLPPQPVEQSTEDREFIEAQQQIMHLLWHESVFETERQEKLPLATQRLLQSPLLERIDVADGIEHWLVNVMSDAMPKSDPMITLVAAHFGWADQRGRIDTHRGVPWLMQRIDDQIVEKRLQWQNHHWHEAYATLIRPFPGDYSRAEKRTIGNQIKEMLDSIRFHNPTIELRFDRDHVAWWDKAVHEALASRKPKAAAFPEREGLAKWAHDNKQAIIAIAGIIGVTLFSILTGGR